MGISTYACYEITADADEDIIPKLFEQKGENPVPSKKKNPNYIYNSKEAIK